MSITTILQGIKGCVCDVSQSLKSIAQSSAELAKDVHLIRLGVYGPLSSEVSGIEVTQSGVSSMASKFKVVALKKAAGMAQARAATKQATPKLGVKVYSPRWASTARIPPYRWISLH